MFQSNYIYSKLVIPKSYINLCTVAHVWSITVLFNFNVS